MSGLSYAPSDGREVQLIANEDPDFLGAYTICLNYEEQVVVSNPNKLRLVRILSRLLLHAPSQGVHSEIAKCIHSRQVSSDLTDIGAFFERTVIVPFKKYEGRTPEHSEYPSSHTSEVWKDELKTEIREAPKNH